MAFAVAVFVCVAFVALADRLGIADQPVKVAAASRRALQTFTDPTLHDDAKERSMRADARALGRLFLVITASALVAIGLPIAAVWLLDAAGVVAFAAVLDALVSWPVLTAGVVMFVGKIGYDRIGRGSL